MAKYRGFLIMHHKKYRENGSRYSEHQRRFNIALQAIYIDDGGTLSYCNGED